MTLTVVAREAGDASGSSDDRIPVAISSEQPVERYEWSWDGVERYFEVLSHKAGEVDLSYARDGLPFVADHDVWSGRQVGLLEEVKVDKDGRLRGLLRQGHHPDAEWLFQDIRAGIRKKVSVGYDPGENYEVKQEKDDKIPTRIYRGWIPMECSSVIIPADYDVGPGRSGGPTTPDPRIARSTERPPSGQETVMAAEAAAADAQAAKERAAAVEQERAAEKQRITNLRKFAKSSQDLTPETVERWIADGTSVDAALTEVAEARAKKDETGPTIFVRSPDGPIQRDGSLKKFETLGEQLRAVAMAEDRRSRPDPRLVFEGTRAASGMSEGSASDGGFAVQTDFLPGLLDPMFDPETGGAIASRVTRFPVGAGANGLRLNLIDETSRGNGSRWGGVQAYWAGEADTVAASKPKLREARWDLKKLFAIMYATEELLEDAVGLEGVAMKAFPAEMLFKLEDAIFRGSGAGMPLGFMGSGALVTQAIEGAQTIANTAANIVANVSKMKSRIPPRMWQNAVWLINSELETKFITATLGGTSAAFPVYMPPGGLSAAPYGSVLGKSVLPVEYCEAEGTPGDLVLSDLSQYAITEKGGIKSSSSVHVRFLNDEQTFKWTYRVDGQPLWVSAITPFKGNATKSPFVALATRS